MIVNLKFIGGSRDAPLFISIGMDYFTKLLNTNFLLRMRLL